ncbi:hypothetical protein NGA_0613100 [Nannochloropsis gaditana CCMP526]|uniref:uncharacterized protein n=1 Tax=Nannochloropsis gaditana (strain CCMP526) TaxID=1093141 RepID=UPI00029F7C90|nr:hypothetical protein NGA_0613100 [Nannochloropsis gaditana CCMP526]EKU20749.1 hypothetical protein NGA_0613100 [Nannochloropsis gaditana CCMP526]|eukprot:XP_005855618.1 hypothetical protein NGA_0613100 [Nannochloropsis gaditana CCMP526]
MHISSGSLCLFLLGLASFEPVVSIECPRFFLQAKVRPNGKRGIMAGRGQAKVTVTLHSDGPASNIQVGLALPNGLNVHKTATKPSSKLYTPQIVRDLDGTTELFWEGIDFTDRKRNKGRFRAKADVDSCAPETLAINAYAFVVNATDVSCITELVTPTIINVRYPSLRRGATCAPTPAPTINPSDPFVPVGEGLRFSRGGQLAPFQRRALSTPSGLSRDMSPASPEGGAWRLLQTINTPADCYAYCSVNGGQPPPFLFEWNRVTRQCYCCMGTCTPFVFDPAFVVFVGLVPPTSAPTTPTPAPTAMPTIAPTPSPTAVQNGSLSLGPGEDYLNVAVVSGDFVYFGTDTPTAKLVKVRLSNFSVADSLDFAFGQGYLNAGFASGDYAYFGTFTLPGVVLRVHLPSFTPDGNVTFLPQENFIDTAVISGDYGYFGTDLETNGLVMRVDLTTFTQTGTLNLETDEASLLSAVISGNYAYFAASTSPGKVIKINLLDFSRVGAVEFQLGQNEPVSAVLSGNHAYFGTYTDPTGIVVPVDLRSFTLGTAVVLTGNPLLTSAAESGGYAYFGTSTQPGVILKLLV